MTQPYSQYLRSGLSSLSVIRVLRSIRVIYQHNPPSWREALPSYSDNLEEKGISVTRVIKIIIRTIKVVSHYLHSKFSKVGYYWVWLLGKLDTSL